MVQLNFNTFMFFLALNLQLTTVHLVPILFRHACTSKPQTLVARACAPVCPSLTIPLQIIDHGRMLMGMCLPIDGTSTNWNSSKIAIHPPKTIKGSLNPPACMWEKKTCEFAYLKYIIIHTHTHTTLQQMTLRILRS